MGHLVHHVLVSGAEGVVASAHVVDPRAAAAVDFDHHHSITHGVEDLSIQDQAEAQSIADETANSIREEIANQPISDRLVHEITRLRNFIRARHPER